MKKKYRDGNWASEIRIVKERVVAPCNYVVVESGTAVVPTENGDIVIGRTDNEPV